MRQKIKKKMEKIIAPLEKSTCGTPIMNAIFSLKKNRKKTRKAVERSDMDGQIETAFLQDGDGQSKNYLLAKRGEAVLETLKTHA